MKSLLLAQGLDTGRAPSGVEFAFVNAGSRNKTYERGANESNSAAEKEQQASKPATGQIHGCIGLDQLLSTHKKVASLSIRLGDRLELRIMFFLDLVHSAVRFGKKLFHRKTVGGTKGTPH